MKVTVLQGKSAIDRIIDFRAIFGFMVCLHSDGYSLVFADSRQMQIYTGCFLFAILKIAFV